MTEVAIDESKLGNVEGKVSLVTGGASGIGKAIVTLLHQRGAIVVFCDLNATAGERVAKELGGRIDFIRCDVTKWNELSAVFAEAKRKHGHIDICFANAGIVQQSDVFADDLDEGGNLAEPAMPVIEVNLKAVILTAKLALHHFKSNDLPGGSLVISASSSSYAERPNLPLYSIAKHGVLGLMRALRNNAPKAGVSVSCIAPGGTASGMVDEKIQASMKAVGIPVQTPEYVAMAAVFLASNKDWNGKSLTLIGFRATEVEGPILDLMPLWYGEYNTDMAARAGGVPINKS